MKNLLILIISFLLIFSTMKYQRVDAQTIGFKDIKGHWAEKTIEQANVLNLVRGYEDGSFRPNNSVTRGEFAAFLGRATTQVITGINENPFTDVTGHWSQADIEKCISLGFIRAADYPNGFSPNTKITRGEITKWMANGLSSKSEDYKQALLDMKDTYVPVREMFRKTLAAKDIPGVGLMLGTGLLSGYTDLSFGLEKNTTRAEVATILLRYMDVENKKADEFLGLRELREVGTMGTNLTTITPLKYGYWASTGQILYFKDIMNKPRTLANDAGSIVVHKLIAVDIITITDFTSIYGKMFISDDFYIQDNMYYFFTLSTVTAHKEMLTVLDLASTGTSLQSGGGLWNKASKDNKLDTIPKIVDEATRHYFKKGVPQQIWGSFRIEKNFLGDIHGVVDDGSRVSIGVINNGK
jgi:hypothetical protein